MDLFLKPALSSYHSQDLLNSIGIFVQSNVDFGDKLDMFWTELIDKATPDS